MGRRSKPRNVTRVFVVQDRSGSMSDRREETISGFNEYVDELEAKGEGDIRLSLIQFDTKVETVFSDKRITDVPALEFKDFVPGGMTALRDGVGQAIRKAEVLENKDDKVLVVIMTDGGENSSAEYSHDDILRQIKDKRKDGWEFVFLGAGEEAWHAGQNVFGNSIPIANRINYGNSKEAHTNAFTALATSNVAYTSNSFLRGGAQGISNLIADQKIKLEDEAQEELKTKS